MKAVNILLALLVSGGIAILIFELGLRLLGFGAPAINTVPDAALGWAKEPNAKIVRSTNEYDVTIETDALGLRDDFEKADPSKPEGTTRVLCLGDSFVLGYAVARKDLFVDQLEAAWKAEGRNVDVVNAGTQAYSTDQSLIWLRENGAKFQPDVVVHFPFENDIWWNGQSEYLGTSKPMFGDDGELATGELEPTPERTFFEKTAIGNMFRKKERMPRIAVGGANVMVEQSSRYDDAPDATKAAEARTKMLIGKMAEAARDMGAEFVVCPLPNREHVRGKAKAGQRPARPYELFVEAAKAANAKLIEPLAALEAARKGDGTPYYDRDFHLDAEGNVVLAGVVYEAFDREGLVPARAEGTEAAKIGAASSAGGGSDSPRWPFWFLGLWAALGTLYSQTYKDEKTVLAYAKVAGLLGIVFATVIGVNALVGVLPPKVGQIVLLGLVIAVLTFVLFKLGERVGTIAELLKAFTLRGHWYLMPLLTVLLTVGSLLVVAASSPLAAPFIYTLF